MHLLDILRSGKSGHLKAHFNEQELHVSVGDQRYGPLYARADLQLHIETGPKTTLLLYAEAMISAEHGNFAPRHRVTLTVAGSEFEARDTELPSNVLPDAFWQELDRRLHEAILQQWRGEQPTPILTDK